MLILLADEDVWLLASQDAVESEMSSASLADVGAVDPDWLL